MIWLPLINELDRWHEARITARLWLRDDDAVAPTSLLDELGGLTERFRIPVTLAIIPASTGADLVEHLRNTPHMTPAIHGWLHANHAPQGEKKQEYGLHRGREAVLEELTGALERMRSLYGDRLVPMLIPPWNRIAPELMPDLPGLGYRALSAFGEPILEVTGLAVVNTHVDLIDFRRTRRCHEHEFLARQIAGELARSRLSDGSAVGILSHHLVEDPSAMRFLKDLFTVTTNHPACRWTEIADLIA